MQTGQPRTTGQGRKRESPQMGDRGRTVKGDGAVLKIYSPMLHMGENCEEKGVPWVGFLPLFALCPSHTQDRKQSQIVTGSATDGHTNQNIPSLAYVPTLNTKRDGAHASLQSAGLPWAPLLCPPSATIPPTHTSAALPLPLASALTSQLCCHRSSQLGQSAR